MQRNDACCPFGGRNYSTVKLYTVVIGSSDSRMEVHAGRPCAPCTALSVIGMRNSSGLQLSLKLTPSDSSGSVSDYFSIAGGLRVVGVCDTPWMTGCQSRITKFKLSGDYQDHGEK